MSNVLNLSLADRLLAPQCGQLNYISATQIKFSPFGGDVVRIAGVYYLIPPAGITYTASGLAASSVYYVYLYSNSGVPTIYLSNTTSHSTDTTSGNVGTEAMNGNNAYSLIGMIYTNASGQFTPFCVLSWFNRRLLSQTVNQGNLSTASTSGAILTGASATVCLNWANVPPCVMAFGQASFNGTYARFAVGVDGASTEYGAGQYIYQTTVNLPTTVGGYGGPSENAHSYYPIGAASSGSGTLTVNNIQINMSTWG